jgi:hypothetical protein
MAAAAVATPAGYGPARPDPMEWEQDNELDAAMAGFDEKA